MRLRKAIRRLLASAAHGVDDGTLRELARQWTRAAWQRELYMGNTWLGFRILQWPTGRARSSWSRTRPAGS